MPENEPVDELTEFLLGLGATREEIAAAGDAPAVVASTGRCTTGSRPAA